MKTRRLWSGMLLGSALALGGCGAGQYQIPNVEPVVKQKPQDDLLAGIEGNDKPAETSAPSTAAPSGSAVESPPASSEKPAEAPKPAAKGPSEKPAEAPKPAPKK